MDEKQTPHVMVDCVLQSGSTVSVPIPHPEATDKPQPVPSLADIFQAAVGK